MAHGQQTRAGNRGRASRRPGSLPPSLVCLLAMATFLSGCITFDLSAEDESDPVRVATLAALEADVARLGTQVAITQPGERPAAIRLGIPIAPENALLVDEVFSESQGLVEQIAWSADGRWLAAGSPLGLHLYDAQGFQDGTAGVSLTETRAKVSSVALSPAGGILAAGMNDGSIFLGRILEDGSVVEDLTWRGLYSPVRYLAFSPSGRLLAAQSYFEADVPVWNVADGTLVYSLEEHRGSSNGLAFSPDGLLIASPLNDPGGQSDSVGLWHALDGGYLRRLEGHTSWVFGIAFSPDSSSMASVGNDTTARIWRLVDGSVIHSLDHPSSVDNVSYSPDGRLLATAAGDSTIRLWDPVEGRLVNSVFAGNLTTRSGLAFSPDGSLLAAGLVNGLVQIWAVRPPPS